MDQALTYTAFLDETLIASGPLDTTLPIVKARFDHNASALVLIFGIKPAARSTSTFEAPSTKSWRVLYPRGPPLPDPALAVPGWA